jgi:cytoskeletal protein RodZ
MKQPFNQLIRRRTVSENTKEKRSKKRVVALVLAAFVVAGIVVGAVVVSAHMAKPANAGKATTSTKSKETSSTASSETTAVITDANGNETTVDLTDPGVTKNADGTVTTKNGTYKTVTDPKKQSSGSGSTASAGGSTGGSTGGGSSGGTSGGGSTGGNTEGSSGGSSGGGTTKPTDPNAGKTWHEAVTHQEKIVDVPAHTETQQVTEYHSICYCGFDLTKAGISFTQHKDNVGRLTEGHDGYRTGVPVTVTKTVNVPATYKYVTVVDKPAGWY